MPCVCIFKRWSFENYTWNFRPYLRYQISCSFSPSTSTHLFLPSSSYSCLPMVVSFFMTHLLLEVTSPIIFHPSRRSKAYKLHMELHLTLQSSYLIWATSYSVWFYLTLILEEFPEVALRVYEVCNAHTWVPLGEDDTCLAYASSPTYVIQSWCLLLFCLNFL